MVTFRCAAPAATPGMTATVSPVRAAGLVRELADRELLAVLDTCAHVLQAAGLVATLPAGSGCRVKCGQGVGSLPGPGESFCR